MQWLNKQTVSEHLTMQATIDTIEALLHLQAAQPNWVKAPERLVIDTFAEDDKNSTGSHLSMPSTIYDGEREFAAVKLVTICPDNPSRDLPTTTAIITVSDNANGEILAVMDGVYITQVRTAALSGVATRYMAKVDCQSAAVVGCGGMAYEQLNAVLTVRPDIQIIRLWNRNINGAEAFKTRFAKEYAQWNVELIVCEELSAAIKDADIINVATRAESGLFNKAQIKPDAHINAVGAYQPSMKEISNDIIASSKLVVVDDLLGSRHEAGDLIQAHDAKDCAWTWDALSGDLQSLVTGELKEKTSSESDKGITLFKSVGAASFDAAVAIYMMQLAQKKNLGTVLF